MKFSDFGMQQWEELRPYMDTCLLPVTGMSGLESPWEATAKLEKLRDVMLELENPYKGRIVTYPAVQYRSGTEEETTAHVNQICNHLKSGAFRFVIVVTADPDMAAMRFEAADLQVGPEPGGPRLEEQIKQLWLTDKQ
ncbi:DUF2487 family protein [Paenibacillus sp. y28]|uniref:DUF2487 family protein n=1 Tax=Paenibacillus sp. y28 TaxID=3129110 RepID=UPI00301B6787